MKIRTAIILTCIVWGSLVRAEDFDPFGLIPKCSFWSGCKVKLNRDVALKYDSRHHDWFNTKLIEARKQRKVFIIMLAKLLSKGKQIYELDINNKEDAIYISDKNLKFTFLEVETKSIIPSRRLCGYYDLYAFYRIEDEQRDHEIWLTDKQQDRLNRLYREKIPKVQLNLSALKRPYTHGKFFPPEEVIIPVAIPLEIN